MFEINGPLGNGVLVETDKLDVFYKEEKKVFDDYLQIVQNDRANLPGARKKRVEYEGLIEDLSKLVR